jgi:hypothetical protein
MCKNEKKLFFLTRVTAAPKDGVSAKKQQQTCTFQ